MVIYSATAIIQCSTVVFHDNVVGCGNHQEKCCCYKQEMNSWLLMCVMVCVLSLFYPCKGYRRDDKKNFMEKEYCEQKRLEQGKREVEYNSFLWSIERPGSPPSYLFGTIHAPSHLVHRYIPRNSQVALLDATDVFTEVDLRDPVVISAIRKCRQLPVNQTIKDVLPKKLFKEFKRVLEKFKASRRKWRRKILKSVYALQMIEDTEYDIYNDYDRLKPMWLTSTILQQWNRFFVKQQLRGTMKSLDRELVDMAADTYRGGIEKVSSHCDPMDNLATDKMEMKSKKRISEAHLALNVTLQALDKKLSGKFHMKENDIRRVINLYKCGNPMDTNRLETLFQDLVSDDMQKQLGEIDEYLLKELMLKRNVLMANTIEKMLKNERYDDARMFVAVGAAHLLGNQSIVTLLRDKGYTVRHVKPNEEIPATIRIKEILTKATENSYSTNESSSWWKRNEEKEKGKAEENNNNKQNQNIFIITKYEKNYVYYYSGSSRISTHCLVSLLSAMSAMLIVWNLCAG